MTSESALGQRGDGAEDRQRTASVGKPLQRDGTGRPSSPNPKLPTHAIVIHTARPRCGFSSARECCVLDVGDKEGPRRSRRGPSLLRRYGVQGLLITCRKSLKRLLVAPRPPKTGYVSRSSGPYWSIRPKSFTVWPGMSLPNAHAHAAPYPVAELKNG